MPHPRRAPPDRTSRLSRRALLAWPVAGPVVLAAVTAAALPPVVRFRVVREGSPIGTHRVTFSEAGRMLTARTEVDIAVKVLGVTVFRFTHRFEEAWDGDRLAGASSRLDRNGRVTEMRAVAAEGAILAEGSAGRFRLPAEAAPLSWWDSRRLAGPLFANDTGEPVALRWARSPLPGGGVLWRASGTEDSEATYAADGTWTGWKTKAEDGSTVVYKRG